jgi:CBS domain-containing protein
MIKLIPELIHDQKFSTVTPKATVREAARTMAERNIGAIMVTEGSRLVGIFSERDIMSRVVAKDLDPDATLVESVMTRNPDSLSPDATVRDAMRLMVAHDYRHVPVMDGQKILGIVSARDIYNNVVKSIQTGVSDLARDLLMQA